MLQRLTLFNYALVDHIELEFGEGLNIFTGETGAGKSVLVGAIAALLGEKAAFSGPRESQQKAVIEGFFANCQFPQLDSFLEERGAERVDEHSLLVRREFYPTGRSRAFINDTPIPSAALDELSEHLADLHGQHEHQSLLRARMHLYYLDSFAGLESLRRQVAHAYDEVRELRKQYVEMSGKRNEMQARREVEEFQLREIERIDPQPEEEQNLADEINLLGNAERRDELARAIYQFLYENETAVQAQLSGALEALTELTDIDPSLQTLLADCRSAEITLLETAQEIRRYQDRIQFDADRLEKARTRLAELNSLKRKYGGTIAEVLNRREELQSSLALEENYQARLTELSTRLQEAERRYEALSLDLSSKRQTGAGQLQELVPQVLIELGLPAARFEVRFTLHSQEDGFVSVAGQRVKAGRDGIDEVEFYISTNRGQVPGPLAKVASGGEISRIMLALKSIVAERDNIPVLIFDEIDSGVSGRVAHAVGRRLQKLSESHQIICITHLPQIASAGHHHYLVEKKSARGRPKTVVHRLDSEGRISAIASLLGGEKITEAHLRSAQELLAEAGNPTS